MSKQARVKPYPKEFREQVVQLAQLGRRPPGGIAKEFGISADSVRRWVRQAERDAGLRQDGLTSAEREELARLKRENRRLRLEREILAKAAAWFARGTVPMPSGRSSSQGRTGPRIRSR